MEYDMNECGLRSSGGYVMVRQTLHKIYLKEAPGHSPIPIRRKTAAHRPIRLVVCSATVAV